MLFLPEHRAPNIPALKKEFADGWAAFRTKRDRAFKWKKLTAADRHMLALLDGLEPGVRTFVASNGPARQELVGRLLRPMRTVYRDNQEFDFLHITIINEEWATGDENTRFDLDTVAFETREILNRVSPDWMAVIELQPFANIGHHHGGKLVSAHVHVTLWGHDIARVAHRVADELNPAMSAGTPGVSAIRVQVIRDSWLDLAHVLRYPFMAVDRCKTLYINVAKGIASIHQSEKGDRFIRYLRMFQILSRFRQRDLMFASGLGVTLQNDAFEAVEAGLRRRAAHADIAISVRGIQEFWRELMPRMGWSRFCMPHIKRPSAWLTAQWPAPRPKPTPFIVLPGIGNIDDL